MRSFRRLRCPWMLLAAFGAAGGCSGARTALTYTPLPDADLDGARTNPAGDAYPTENIGGRPRSGSQPGQIFPNLTLLGVRSKATLDRPEAISMAEYYDPEGIRYDLLHVVGLFMWCPHCRSETKDLVSIAAWQAEHRVAAVQIAMQGYGSASPGWSEVERWVTDHNLGFPLLVDGQGEELGKYFKVSSVPVNIAVNPRTMEVMDVKIGDVGGCQAYEQKLLNSL